MIDGESPASTSNPSMSWPTTPPERPLNQDGVSDVVQLASNPADQGGANSVPIFQTPPELGTPAPASTTNAVQLVPSVSTNTQHIAAQAVSANTSQNVQQTGTVSAQPQLSIQASGVSPPVALAGSTPTLATTALHNQPKTPTSAPGTQNGLPTGTVALAPHNSARHTITVVVSMQHLAALLKPRAVQPVVAVVAVVQPRVAEWLLLDINQPMLHTWVRNHRSVRVVVLVVVAVAVEAHSTDQDQRPSPIGPQLAYLVQRLHQWRCRLQSN